MSHKQPARRKRRTREHIIADLSLNFVERQALLCGFAVQRRQPDYGLDLMVFTYNSAGENENGLINFQVKATDAPDFVFEGQSIAVRIDVRHFRHWLLEPMPVLLVLYDAPADVAYWLYIQAYFQRRNDMDLEEFEGSLTVHVPRANVLDLAAMRKFAGYRDQILEQSKGISHRE